jgi:hypothetical protein
LPDGIVTDMPSYGDAASRRDAALARLAFARRGALIAAAGLSGGFAALVSALAPGKSLAQLHPKPVVAAAPVPAPVVTPPKMPRLKSAAELGLQAPSAPPQAASAPAQPAPVEQAPVEQAPVQQAPVQQAPVQQAPLVTPAAPSAPVVSGGS